MMCTNFDKTTFKCFNSCIFFGGINRCGCWHKHCIVNMTELRHHIKISLMYDQPQGISLLLTIDTFMNKVNTGRNVFLE